MTVQTTALHAAFTQLGVPYVWGGASPKGSPHPGFDCSGLTLWSYLQAGVTLPHSSIEQFQLGPQVASPEPGDIAYFLGIDPVGTKTAPGHCAICATAPVDGLGTMVQAEESGTVVMLSGFDINDGQYVGATRPGIVPVPWPGYYLAYPPLLYTTGCVIWQARMNARMNAAWGAHLTVDGFYGPLSKAACMGFQAAHPPLAEDGIVGPLTWSAVFA